jgi:hypothetical protein
LALATGNKIYENHASELIDGIYEKMRDDSCWNMENLTGIGIGFEYLNRHGFVGGDIGDILAAFDKKMFQISSTPQLKMNGQNIVKCGKYYISRYTNSITHGKTEQSEIFAECLAEIVNYLSIPYNTYNEIYGIVDILSDAVSLGINQKRSTAYLNYAVDKLETMVNEDIHFGVFSGSFNPLLTWMSLQMSAEKTGNKEHAMRALYFLNAYEPVFRQHFSLHQSITWSFLYRYLWTKNQVDTYKELSGRWLNASQISAVHPNGLVQRGMTLLALSDQCSDDWLSLVSLYK